MDDSDQDSNSEEGLTPGEMAQILTAKSRQIGVDTPEFEAFMDSFCVEHANAVAVISEVFVTAIHINSVELANIILSKYYPGVDINHQSVSVPGRHTPLTASVRGSHWDLLRKLLDLGADLSGTTASGDTALDLLCESCSVSGVQLILDHMRLSGNVSGGTQKDIGHAALMTAAHCGYENIVGMLIEYGADVNRNTDVDLGTPLHRAVESGSISCVDRLIRAGADIETLRQRVLQTPLMRAAEYGHTEILCRLLKEGAEVNRMTEECSSALTLACHYGQTDCVRSLIDHGADIHQRNSWGFTPLFMGTDTPEIVRILVKAGVNLDEKCGERGEAALHLASLIGCCDTIKLLLDEGADINITTYFNETPMWLAIWKGHENVCRLLLQRNCKLGYPSHSCHVYAHEYTELELAIGLHHFGIVRMLLLAGCPLRNSVYYSNYDPGPINTMDWVKLRTETLQVLQEYPEEFEWFRNFVMNPRLLKDICSIRLRQLLITSLEKKLKSLHAPEDIVAHVCMKYGHV